MPRVLSGYKEKSMPQMATDLRALLLGGWGEREGDFAKAVRLMKADLGGACVRGWTLVTVDTDR